LSVDLALINTNVRTMDACKPVAQAVAISKNRIVRVGTNQEIKQLVDKGTRVISLDGKTVVPGLIDTHIHVADFGKCLLWLDLTNAKSIKELKSLLKEKAKRTTAGKWIIGRGWNENRFKEKRLPNISDLDEAAPDNPVILYHEKTMTCAVNSKALALACITVQTSAPSGGSIDKSSQTGALTGILRDNATNMVWQVVPEPTADELSQATSLACQKIVEAGVASVHWLVLSRNELSIIQSLHTEGKLPIRVNVIVPEEFSQEINRLKSTDNLLLRFGGVFIAVDGYLDSKTAALSQPYSDDPNNTGTMFCTQKELSSSVARVLVAGFDPVIHAMGDRAVDTALKVIEQTQSPTAIRFRIEQAAILNKQLIERMKKQNIVVSIQPRVIATEFAVWSAITSLGFERAQWLHPLKTLLSNGVKIAGGSDCPMEPLNPLLGIQEAVIRECFPEQRLSAEEALRMYTLDAAFCSGEEKIHGSIEEGKLADLTVLSQDPMAVEHTKIKDIDVELSIVNGFIVYSKHPLRSFDSFE
jgi:predicted amidohydrolase YtcJ